MRVRRATLDLDGEARTAVANGHVKDGIHARIRPVCGGEILHLQTGVSQPPYRVHKHIAIISTVVMSRKNL
jgi:hypothetical protein